MAIKVKLKADLRSSVEGKEAENKDESSKSSKRHRVTRDVHRLPIYKPWKSEAFGQGDKKVWTINCPIQLCSLIVTFGHDDIEIVRNRQLNCVLWQIYMPKTKKAQHKVKLETEHA